MNSKSKPVEQLYKLYSPEVLDHFEHPRNGGEVADPTAVVELENPVCADVLQLSARVVEGRVVEIRFLAQGCVPVMACGSLVTELAQGLTLDELGEITPDRINAEIGELRSASHHAAQLAADTLQLLTEKLALRQ